jgi:hypothetical protein
MRLPVEDGCMALRSHLFMNGFLSTQAPLRTRESLLKRPEVTGISKVIRVEDMDAVFIEL